MSLFDQGKVLRCARATGLERSPRLVPGSVRLLRRARGSRRLWCGHASRTTRAPSRCRNTTRHGRRRALRRGGRLRRRPGRALRPNARIRRADHDAVGLVVPIGAGDEYERDAQVRTRPRAVEPRGGASTNRAPCHADDHHVGPFGLVAENVEWVPVHDVRFERHVGMASDDVSEDTAEIGLGVGAHRFDLKCEQRNLARRPDGEQHRHEDARDRVDLARRRCASSAAHRRGATEGCEPSNSTTSRSNMLTSSDAGLGPGQGFSPWV